MSLTNENWVKLNPIKIEGKTNVNKDIIADSEENDLSNKGFRETLGKNW